MRRGKEIASLPSSFLPPLLLRQLEPVSLPSFRMTTGGGGRLSVRPSDRPLSSKNSRHPFSSFSCRVRVTIGLSFWSGFKPAIVIHGLAAASSAALIIPLNTL